MTSSTVPFRKRLLHILLWCLGGSAATGVLTVMLPSNQLMWRVTAMGFVGAAAIGLMIPCSLLADRERFRIGGFLGMILCVLAFVLSIGLIWASALWFGSAEERIGMTLGLVVFMGPAAVGFACIRGTVSGRIGGTLGLGVAALASVFYLGAIWSRTMFIGEDMIAMSAIAINWTGFLASLCMIGFGTDTRYWRWVGVAGAIAAAVMWLYGIWARLNGDPQYIVCAMSVAAFVAFANVMLRASLTGGQRLVIYGTIAAAGAVALFVDLQQLTDDGNYGDRFGFVRFIAGASIVTVSGTLAVLVLLMLNRRAGRRVAYAVRAADSPGGTGEAGAGGTRELLKTIWVRCPRCQKEQTLKLGEASCSECKLVIHTSVEMPICAKCGYDISMIKGDKCPECGAGIG